MPCFVEQFPAGLGFRCGQRRTTQTVPLRFAAATLLRYCAYSIETRPLPRPSCIEPLHPRPSTFPELGTRPSILSLL